MSAAGDFAAALSGVNDLLTTVVEATAGYREKLLAAGFNETAAELMAMQYHQELMTRLFRGER